MNYPVKQGDCMSSIAVEVGFFWRTLWNLPENAALKLLRKNPNVLLAGDNVYVPEIRQKTESRPDGARYKFVRKGVPEKLRIRLKDAQNRPRPNLDYTIVIDGKPHHGKTDARGELIESIHPGAKSGKLIVVSPAPPPAAAQAAGKSSGNPPKLRREVMNLNLGHLDPISELTGVRGRLANLKFYRGPMDDFLDDNTLRRIREAIWAFQNRVGLPLTGVADDATKALLQKMHGH